MHNIYVRKRGENMVSNKKQKLLKQLAIFEDVIQGTITERRHQCGKATCRCKSDAGFLHSSFQLSFAVKGKTKTITIPKDKVPMAKKGLREYQKMREVRKYSSNPLRPRHP
jgi:hypothetical protein